MKVLTIATLMLITMNATAQDSEPTNKHFWYSLPTTASAEQIWQVWTDVPNWKNWDTGLQDATLEGDFMLDAKGTILSLEGRTSKFKIVDIDPGRSYTMKTNLPLGGLYVKRYLDSSDGQLTFTHEVWFTGLTKGIFAKAFGEKFRNMLPEVLENVKAIAEAKR
ncbi:MAG: SRPBCC family protein [Bacteroidota bacterium]